NINDSTLTTLAFDTENYDTDNYHDNITNNSRLTIPTTGYYGFGVSGLWGTQPVGYRKATIYQNDTTALSSDARTNVVSNEHSLSMEFHLTAGDYLTVKVFQTSGGVLSWSPLGGFWISRRG